MRQPKTPLLKNLLAAMNKAMAAHHHQLSPAEWEARRQERRDFLLKGGKAALAAGLLSTMQGCSKVLDTIAPYPPEGRAGLRSNDKNGTRIAIVGAGMAGLHAGFVLKQQGFLANLYEGSTRTGGRMYTAKNIMGAGLTTELGGEFIDSIHKDMLKLVKTFDLELLDTLAPSESGLVQQAYFAGGVHYTEQQVIDTFALYAPAIRADQKAMSGIIDVDNFSPADQMLDQMSIAAYFDKIGLQGWLRQMLDVAYLTEYGQPIDQQTALNFLWLIDGNVTDKSFDIFGLSDERYKIRGGNQQLCDKLAETLDGQISLGHELQAIREESNGSYRLTFHTAGGTVEVVADVVLLTLPFTLLRQVEVQPAWPGWKQQAIFDIGYGNNSKLLMGFDSKYWRDLGYAGYYFTDNMLQSGWDNSALQGAPAGGLTIYSGGQQAIDVGVGTAMSQAMIHLPLVEQMYPGAQAHFANRAERFVWPAFPWSRCSYTCFRPGQYTTIAGNEIKPVGNIFFAGEHCSYDYQGYMNGAAETGRRAAEAILKKNVPAIASGKTGT